MPKLIIVNRRLGVVARHLVTDAGGAPCCCGPGEVCPCDPALRLQAFRADTCRNGTTGPNVFDASDPARIAVVRLEWGLQWDRITADRIGTSSFTAFAERGSSVGEAQWCVVHSPSGQNDLVWTLAGAASSFEYDGVATNTREPPPTESLNYEGPDALLVPIPARFRVGFGWKNREVAWVPNTRSITWRQGPRDTAGLPIPWFPIYVEQDNRCNQTLNFVDGDISESLQYDFSGGVAGGQAAYANAYRSNIGNSRNERNAQWFARWSVQYLTCDGTGQSELAGGCANCGDRSTLEPFV